MNIIQKITKRFLNKEFKIVNQSKKQQSIVLRNEKVINPNKLTDDSIQLDGENGITHKVVLAINEKLSVYGVGEISSYDFNRKGELIMDLSLYDNKIRMND